MPPPGKNNFGEELEFCNRCGNPADKKILTKEPLCRKCALELAAQRQAQKAAAKAPEKHTPKAPAGPKEWKVILEDGTAAGPYDLPTLKQLVQQKKVTGFAKVSQAGGIWQKAYTVPQLAELFRVAPPKEALPPEVPEQKIKKQAKTTEEDVFEEFGFKVEPLEEREKELLDLSEEGDLPELELDTGPPRRPEQMKPPRPPERKMEQPVDIELEEGLPELELETEPRRPPVRIKPPPQPPVRKAAKPAEPPKKVVAKRAGLGIGKLVRYAALILIVAGAGISVYLAKDYLKKLIPAKRADVSAPTTTPVPEMKGTAGEFYQRGVEYLSQYTLEGYQKAEEEFKQALEVNPEFAHAQAALAENYMRWGRTISDKDKVKDALKLAKKSVKTDPNLAYGYRVIASINYYDQKDVEEAEKYALKAVELDKEDWESLYILGSIYFQVEDKVDFAIKYLKDTVKYYPDLLQAHVYLASLYEKLEDHRSALVHREKMVELKADNSEWFYALGMCYWRNELFDKAIGSYKKSVELEPERVPARIELIKLLFEFKKAYQEAQENIGILLRDYFQFLTQDDLKYFYFVSGRIYHLSGSLEMALARYQEVLKLDPRHEDTYFWLGDVYYQQEQFYESEKQYRIILQLNSSSARAYLGWGKVLSRLGRNDLAITQYQKAIELDPSYAEPYYILGNLFQQREQVFKAIDSYRNAVKRDPGHVDAHYQLAKLSDGVGEAETAIKHYNLVKKADPKYGDVTYFLGELYLREGNMKKARAEFRLYLKQSPRGTYAAQAKKALEMYGR
ncbi:MAG: tetratricopeptide repeat protein [Deltaproteobacteria bacterium]|nr:MAG: tetratricopeptide repeat protein [Deltaproteobacteria bacterium]